MLTMLECWGGGGRAGKQGRVNRLPYANRLNYLIFEHGFFTTDKNAI